MRKRRSRPPAPCHTQTTPHNLLINSQQSALHSALRSTRRHDHSQSQPWLRKWLRLWYRNENVSNGPRKPAECRHSPRIGGGFEKKLFIDEVDHYFCLRAKSKGCRFFQDPACLMEHNLGQKQRYGSFIKTRLKTTHPKEATSLSGTHPTR